MADFDRYERRMARRQFRGHSGLVGGIIVAGIGVFLLLQNLGIPYFDDLGRFWPLILIVVGALHGARALGAGGRLWGGAISAVGVIFLLHNLEIIHGDVWRFFWPMILICVGIGMLGRVFDRSNSPVGAKWTAGGTPGNIGSSTAGSSALNTLSEWAVFGGVRRRIDSQDFEGGDATATFGGVELDLRYAATKRDEIFIEANAVFGGIEIRVPDTWNVTVRGTGIFGGYEDKTFEARPVTTETKRPNLVVNGYAIFGGITVQN